MARQHWLVRLGLVAGFAGSLVILSACSRPGSNAEPTAAPTVAVRTSPSPSRTSTRAATPSAPPVAPGSAPPAAAPTQTPAPAAATATTAPPAATGQKYVVQPGDTLSGIAEMFGITVQELIDANKLENPNLIVPGQELVVPGR